MNRAPDELVQLQAWMQAVLMHPGGVIAGVESNEARRHLDIAAEAIDSVISPSQQQTSLQRLEVYSRAYYARLIECLRHEYPMLAVALGEEVFDQFAAGYLQSYPSHSYTLNRLGAEFAAYLAATRPTGNDNLWLDFLVDLARLEWCFSEVFDGPGPESQEILRVETLCRIPADQWPACRLAPVAGLRLLTFDYPVHELYRALRRREPLVLPVARQTHLVVWRRDFIVRHDELTDMQFGLLAALVQGHTIGQAIEEAARQACDIPMLSQNLAAWFQIWFGAGLFDRVLH